MSSGAGLARGQFDVGDARHANAGDADPHVVGFGIDVEAIVALGIGLGHCRYLADDDARASLRALQTFDLGGGDRFAIGAADGSLDVGFVVQLDDDALAERLLNNVIGRIAGLAEADLDCAIVVVPRVEAKDALLVGLGFGAGIPGPGVDQHVGQRLAGRVDDEAGDFARLHALGQQGLHSGRRGGGLLVGGRLFVGWRGVGLAPSGHGPGHEHEAGKGQQDPTWARDTRLDVRRGEHFEPPAEGMGPAEGDADRRTERLGGSDEVDDGQQRFGIRFARATQPLQRQRIAGSFGGRGQLAAGEPGDRVPPEQGGERNASELAQ